MVDGPGLAETRLKPAGAIEIPDSAGSSFDHGAFEPQSRRVFVAHTGRDRVEVIDAEQGRHLATLDGFPEAAGVVADGGSVLVTNRGSAQLAWVDAQTLRTRVIFDTGARPNGVALVARLGLAAVACIGDETHPPALQIFDLEGRRRRAAIDLPGRPRWCVTDAAGARLFLAIRDPSMVLVARLPDLDNVQRWLLPAAGAHGLDIDRRANLLYVACDGAELVEIDALSGSVRHQWPLAGAPDATFFNPESGLVHVAIEEPGLVQTIDPRRGASTQISTAPGAKTTALVPPDHLYVFSSLRRGAIDFAGA